MKLDELLEQLAVANITLVLEDNDVRFQGSVDGLTEEMRVAIATHRNEIFSRLQSKNMSHTVVEAPLSFYQERLWVYFQKNPRDISYNIPVVFLVTGNLDVTALEKSLFAIVERHDSLRTTFHILPDGNSVQRVQPHSQFQLPIMDAREAEINKFIVENATHVFDLTTGPLLIAKLLRQNANEHLLLVNVHHIVSDAWSIVGIFLTELYEFYDAFCTQRPPRLQPLRMQYPEFSKIQRITDVSTQLRYWQNQLNDYEDTLELPADYLRTPQSGKSSEIFTYKYSQAFSRGLAQFSKDHRCTLFISLLSGFALAVNRYTGKSDLCIGTTVAGRNMVDLEPLIGFLVNILPLRIRIDEEMTVREYMQHVREVTLAGFDHQMVPFEQILQTTHTAKRGSRNALVPLVLRHQNFPQAKVQRSLPGNVAFSAYSGPQSAENPTEKIDVAARCELEISYTGDGENLEVEIVFASDLYTRSSVEALMAHSQEILTSFFQDSDKKIQDAHLLSSSEIQRLCAEYNATDQPLSSVVSLADRFDAQFLRTPDAIACHDQEGEWTYRDIAAKSNQLARLLIDGGVVPGDIVGLCLERSASVLISILAVWKAGAAYVPLDPAYPSSYLQQIIQDAAPRFTITNSSYEEKLGPTSTQYISLNRLAQTLASHSSEAINQIKSSSFLAYLMYTSGSTGVPKGVRVPHIQLVNWLEGLERQWPFANDEMVGQKTTIAFAPSVKELFAGLVNGCPQVIIGGDTVQDTSAFVAALMKHKVTRLNIVPSHLDAVLAYLRQHGMQLPHLRMCITAGEPLTAELVGIFRRQLPHARLINNYGCTELNDITYYDTSQFTGTQGFVPIGRPIQNTRLYVLDRLGRLVPTGVPGELHVATIGIADGYHEMPDMTTERFMRNPFADCFDGRMYNTGDVVKYLPDGNIEYIGRWDQQVKVRGFRVDVRQVEKVLGDFDGMGRRAVVGDGERLLAFYEKSDADKLDLPALRSFLQKRLPSYMVPDAFIAVEMLPRLPNGKLNRRALRAAEGALQQSDAFEKAETGTEIAMVNIWAEVLGISSDEIGRNAHFFEIGGHSLAATRVVARIKEQLGLEIGLSKLFEQPQLHAISAYVESLAPQNADVQPAESSWTLKESTTTQARAEGTRLLQGKVVLVTGASRGIGEAIATLLANNGAKVAINYRENEDHARKVKNRIEQQGGVAEIFQADVTQMDAVSRMVQDVTTTLGAIDVLVANAAIGFLKKSFISYEWEDFERKLTDELKAVFYPCKTVAPAMISRRTGNIVVVSSVFSKHPGNGYVAHSTAKSAVDAFVRSLAAELGPDGIRVNTVAPGLVLTDATADLPVGQKTAAAANSPLRRNGVPHDIAGTVLFLASDLSAFTTGCYLPVDGGNTML